MDRPNKSAWLYGVNPVREAIRAGRGIKVIYISAGRHKQVGGIKEEAAKMGVPVKIMHDPDFFNKRFPKGHQDIAAEVEGGEEISLDALLEIPAKKNELPFFVVLDGIEDPRNLGAIVRSAEAAGAHGVVIQEHRTATPGPEAFKTSAGAMAHIPVCIVTNIKNAIDEMKAEGIRIIGAEAGDNPAPWDVDMSGPVAIVIGSEDKGIRRIVKERCDIIVSLPIRGKVNSLNTSVAAGIMFFEYLRQNPKLR